jgi:cupredoxin-like protein
MEETMSIRKCNCYLRSTQAAVLFASVALAFAALLPAFHMTLLAAPANSVDVSLSEYKIDMPSTIPAGPTMFKVTNVGDKTHTFKIEGNDLEEKLKDNLKKGESGTLEVDLKPGSYKVTCPVMGHDHKGMALDLTVTP